MYLVTMLCSALVSVIGLSAMFSVRAQRHIVEGDVNLVRARLYASSVLELGLERLERRTDWRTALTQGTWVSDRDIDDGKYAVTLVDPVDGDFTNNNTDSLRLTAYVVIDGSRYALRANATPDYQPIDALRFAIHTASNANVRAGTILRVGGDGISANTAIANNGAILGSAEANSVGGGGTVTGSTDTAAAAKTVPGTEVYDLYAARAQPLPVTNLLEAVVLSPNNNPYGTPSPDGVYSIDSTTDVVLRGVRIVGTLVVNLRSGRSLQIVDTVLITPARPDYPALIVNGDAEIEILSGAKQLDETEWAVNFNPVGAPYSAEADLDQKDAYPNEIQGLVHVTGSLALDNTAAFRGIVLAGDRVVVNGSPQIDYDATLYANPPEGYYDLHYRFVRGSLEQVAFPSD